MSYRPVPEQYKGKMFPKVWEKELLKTWDEPENYAVQIQTFAMGLSRNEVLEYYNLDEYDLSDYDYWFFDCYFKRGRALARQSATAALFNNMNGDSRAVMNYLQRFGKEEWLMSQQNNTEVGVKSIKLTLDDGTSLT